MLFGELAHTMLVRKGTSAPVASTQHRGVASSHGIKSFANASMVWVPMGVQAHDEHAQRRPFY